LGVALFALPRSAYADPVEEPDLPTVARRPGPRRGEPAPGTADIGGFNEARRTYPHLQLPRNRPDAQALHLQLADFSRMSRIPDKPPSRHGGCQNCAQQGHPWPGGTTSTQLNAMPSRARPLVLLLRPEGGGRGQQRPGAGPTSVRTTTTAAVQGV